MNPLTLLRTRHYVGSSGAVAVGVSDVDSREDANRVAGAAKSAGMDSHLFELPGAHDWWLFSAALDLRVDEDQVWVSLTNTALLGGSLLTEHLGDGGYRLSTTLPTSTEPAAVPSPQT